jgi:ribosomal RNA assembly protein
MEKSTKEEQTDQGESLHYSFDLKIPKERVGVLIGKNGEVKREVEEVTHCRLDIDSSEGDVHITGEDSLGIMTATDVVKAIGRGCNPDVAMKLLKSDYAAYIMTVPEFTGKSPKKMKRLKGRVIGKEGKSRTTIEDLTDTSIIVYGKTITIIGLQEDVACARQAVESLLSGSPHAAVYAWLEKKKRESKRNQMKSFL